MALKKKGFRKLNSAPWAGAKPHKGSIGRPTNVFRKPRKKGFGSR